MVISGMMQLSQKMLCVANR